MKRIALFLLIALTACAATDAHDHRFYISNINYGAHLTPPPVKNSPAWRADLDAVMAAQKKYTASDVAHAKDERDLRPELTAAALGKNFTRMDYPQTYVLLDRAEQDCKSAVEEAKLYWHTLRPYQQDVRVKALVPAHSNGAYPSGHTACSRLLADILADLYPKKKFALVRRADAIAQHRVLAGMHYPADLAGGRELAAQLYHDMQTSPAYQTDFNAARGEVQ